MTITIKNVNSNNRRGIHKLAITSTRSQLPSASSPSKQKKTIFHVVGYTT